MKNLSKKSLMWILILVLMNSNICSIAAILELPRELIVVQDEAFYGVKSIDKVVLHDGIIQICDMAFADSSLTEINLPASIEDIKDDAFDGCGDINMIVEKGTYAYDWAIEHGYLSPNQTMTPTPKPTPTPTPKPTPTPTPTPKPTPTPTPKPTPTPTPSEFDYFVGNEGGVYIEGYLGDKTTVVIPNSIEGKPVTHIWESAFEDCSTLENISLPNSLTYIGKYAFYGCENLKSISIPNGVTSIKQYAFYGCSNLKSIVIPNSVTSIETSAFIDCQKLYTLNLPSNITSIGKNALYNCHPKIYCKIGSQTFTALSTYIEGYGGSSVGARKIIDPDYPDWLVDTSSTIDICKYLGSDSDVTVPSSFNGIEVYGLRENSFINLDTLKSIHIEEGVQSIEWYSFKNCRNLTNITIPESVTNIHDPIFQNCGYVVFYVVKGSSAHSYAEDNGYQFELIS